MEKVRKGIFEFSFVLAVCVELFMGVLHHAGHFIPGTRFILWLLFAVYCIMAFSQCISKHELILLVIFETIGVILYMKSGVNTGIKMPIFVLACKKVELRRLAKYMLYVLVISFFSIILLNLFFNVGETYFASLRGFNGMRIQFGFTNPNVCQFIATMIMLFTFYLFNDDMKLWMRMIIGVIMVFFMIATCSRTGAILGLFIFIAFVFLRYCRLNHIENYLFGLQICSFIFLVCISMLAAFQVENGLLSLINTIISGRMNQLDTTTNSAGTFLLAYAENWSLFSSKENKNFYDMGYIQIFYYYGIVPAIGYLGYVVYGYISAWKNKDFRGQLAILGCTIYMFMESLMFTNYLPFDFLFLFSTFAIWKGKNIADEKKK